MKAIVAKESGRLSNESYFVLSVPVDGGRMVSLRMSDNDYGHFFGFDSHHNPSLAERFFDDLARAISGYGLLAKKVAHGCTDMTCKDCDSE